MPSSARLAGRILMLTTSIVLLVVVFYFVGIPPCAVAAPLFAVGIVLLVGAIGVGAFADKLCGISVEPGNGVLRVRLGVCGELLIPFESIVSVRLVDRVKPVLRLVGSAIPGVYYSGYFMLSGGDKAYIFSERLEHLVEVRLASGETVYLGGNAVEVLSSLTRVQREGGGEGGGWIVRGSSVVRITLLLLAAAVAVAGAIAYPYLPSKVPIHFTSSWKPDSWSGKGEALAVYYAVAGAGVALAALHQWFTRRDPVAGLITAIAAAGLMLLALAILLLVSPACPWAKPV